jgi:hypothetical protein
MSILQTKHNSYLRMSINPWICPMSRVWLPQRRSGKALIQ